MGRRLLLLLTCLSLVIIRPAWSAKDKEAGISDEEMFSFLDMKIFHDSQIVQGTMLQLYGNQIPDAVEHPKLTEGILSEKDSAVLEKTMKEKQIKYQVTPELYEKAGEKPFEAFKDLMKSASVPKITREEMKELGKVDDKAIPEMLQMVTESGPDLGAGRVSVIYEDEAQN